MRFAPALLLAACAPSLPEHVDPAHDLSAALTEGAAHLPERARTLEATFGSLTPGGALLDGDPWPGSHEWVVADASDEVAVIWTGTPIQVGMWLPRDALDVVAAEHTWVGGEGFGVRIPPGLSVEVAETQAGRARVKVGNDALDVDGWVSERMLDEVWFDDLADPGFDEGEGDGVLVRPEIELLDGPLGAPFAKITAEVGYLTARVVAVERGHVRIRMDARGWPVDAWVHEDDLDRSAAGGWSSWSFGCGGCCGLGLVTIGEPNVRADTWLRAEPDGPIVGRVREDTWLELDGASGDWARTEVQTPFGTAWLWVDPADVLGG